MASVLPEGWNAQVPVVMLTHLKGNAALQQLWAALEQRNEVPPSGSITAYDYVKKYKVSRAAAACRLNRDVTAGKLETGLFFNPEFKGKIRYYWLPTREK